MPNRHNMFIVILAVTTATIYTCRAASFDCAKVATQTEKLICANPALSTADEVMAAAYKKALGLAFQTMPEDVKQLRADQLAWLTQRDADCADRACLAAEYQGRSNALSYYAGLLTGGSSDLAGTYGMVQRESTHVVPDSGNMYVQKLSSSGSLSIVRAPKGLVRFGLHVEKVFNATTGDVRLGDASGQVAVEQGVANYTDPDQPRTVRHWSRAHQRWETMTVDSCKITMTFSRTKVAVSTSACASAFGLNVSVDGVYMKTGDSVPISGTYDMVARPGSLELAERLGGKFSFALALLSGNVRTGNLEGEVEFRNSEAVYAFDHGDVKCRIVMEFFPGDGGDQTKVELSQKGECGFGTGVDASGTYERVSSVVPKLPKQQ